MSGYIADPCNRLHDASIMLSLHLVDHSRRQVRYLPPKVISFVVVRDV
jgi:hypothetical protein